MTLKIRPNAIEQNEGKFIFPELDIRGPVVINDPGNDVDVRIESDTRTHALFVQGSDGRVGINKSSPNKDFHVGGDAEIDGALSLGDVLDVSSMIRDDTNPLTIYSVSAIDLKVDGGGEITVNDTGADVDFRVEGDTIDDVLFINGGTDEVYIGGQSGLTGNETSMLGLQARVPSDVATNVYKRGTGIELGDLEGGEIHGYLQQFNYGTPSGSPSWQAEFMMMGINVHFDPTTQTWRLDDNTTYGSMFELYAQTHSTGTYAAMGFFNQDDGAFNDWLSCIADPNSEYVVVNDDGRNMDFRAEGDTVDDVLFLNAGEDRLYIGGQSGAPANYGGHLILQARDPGATSTDFTTGIMMGDFEGTPGGGGLDYFDFNAGTGTFAAYFETMNSNLWWDAPNDAWKFHDDQHGGVLLQLFQRYDTQNDASAFGLGYYEENVGGDPTTFINWINGTSNNTAISGAELVVNDDGADMDFRVESDGNTNALKIDGGTDNLALFGAGSFGSGTQVIFIANATAAPSSNPTGGGILYVESGALKYRGSGGTVTTIASA